MSNTSKSLSYVWELLGKFKSGITYKGVKYLTLSEKQLKKLVKELYSLNIRVNFHDVKSDYDLGIVIYPTPLETAKHYILSNISDNQEQTSIVDTKLDKH